MKKLVAIFVCLLLVGCGTTTVVEEEPELIDDGQEQEERDVVEPSVSEEELLVISEPEVEQAEEEPSSPASEPSNEEEVSEEEGMNSEEGTNSEESLNPEQRLMNVKKFELELDFLNDDELELSFEQKKDKQKAEIERDGSVKEKRKGDEALQWIVPFLQALSLEGATSGEQLYTEIITSLNIDESEIEKFELKIDYVDREKLEYKREF